MHAWTRLIEMLSHDPLMLIFCGVMALLIANVSGMWIVTTLWSRAERGIGHGR